MTITREFLEELSCPSDDDLSHHEIMGKKSAIKRGLPYYGRLRKEFPIHFNAFRRMHKRNVVEFPMNVEGFISFILVIGPVPKDMSRPSVGRKDHSVGYLKDNYRWESLSDNSREAAIRCRPKGGIYNIKRLNLMKLLADGTHTENDLLSLSGYNREQDLQRAIKRLNTSS